MRSLISCIVALYGMTGLAQETRQPVSSTRIAVELKPGEPGSKLAPRYSPPGRQLKLHNKPVKGLVGQDFLEARLNLGPNKTEFLSLVVGRSEKGKPYDLLFVEPQDDKQASSPIRITPKVIRDKHWSSFETTVQINHGKPGEPLVREAYPIALWIVVEKEADVPEVIRISRRGFLTGKARIGESMCDVVLSDSNNDGVLGSGDWWELRGKTTTGSGMRSVGDFAWAGGKAWKLELAGTNGRKAHIVSFDPGMTEEEDTIRRDRLRDDRSAVRAARPVTFRKDVDAALKEVSEKKATYFMKFETDWCVPCKQMSELVFTARDVADAASGITCLVVDGDARKDLTEKHKVKAYPTGILFDASGNEIVRYVGYQGVKDTTAFFKKANK